MAIDLQSFINNILSAQSIEARTLTLSSTLSTITPLIDPVPYNSDEIDVDLILKLGELPYGLYLSPPPRLSVTELAYHYMEKIATVGLTRLGRNFVVTPDGYFDFSTKGTLSSNPTFRPVLVDDFLSSPSAFKQLVRELISDETNVYAMFMTFNKIMSSVSMKADTMSAYFASEILQRQVNDSSAFQSGDVLYQVGVVYEDAVELAIAAFEADPDMTLKEFQEDLFFRVWESAP